MTKSIAIAQEFTTFRQVTEKLGLSLSEDSQFFTEWMIELPALSEAEQMRLEAAHPNLTQPVYGMITNGSSYLFVKVLGKQ